MLADSRLDREFQPHGCLLGKQHGLLKAIQDVHGVC